MTPRQILGISPGASMDEVRKAYKKLAQIHHPDKGGNSRIFNEIHEAYVAAVNEDSFNNNPELAAGFGDFLKKTFEKKPIKPIRITLEEAFSGKEITIDNNPLIIMPGIRETRYDFNNYIIDIIVKTHRLFRRNKNDLMAEVKITWYEALLGKSCEMKHVSGQNIKFDIPEDSRKDQIIKLTGLGMPDPRDNDHHGDLYIILDVEHMTKKDLTSPLLDSIITQYKSSINETKIIR